MTDVTMAKPLHVSTEGRVRPIIELPFNQIEDVRRLLDSHGISHWVSEHVLSFNGGPEMAKIYFVRGADAAPIQAILDSVP